MPSGDLRVALPLKNFLQLEQCPHEWRYLNLYLIRDEEVAFYIGQSYLAFERVWRHFFDGFKGRSVIGRFILCNWPASMRFTIEFLSSQSSIFDTIGHNLDSAERALIEQLKPCLNTALNPVPTPIPSYYAEPIGELTFSRRPITYIRQAAVVIQAEKKKAWLDQEGWGD